ncbi:hypothetical protein RA2_03943 [Roseovarius sp. A-2]|nr:hypothetical protein RA2_03943 [Roseovarius sp. A-2]
MGQIWVSRYMRGGARTVKARGGVIAGVTGKVEQYAAWGQV